MTAKRCSFTGHRPSSFCFGYNENDLTCKKLKHYLKKSIIHAIECNVKVFNTGMALGFDMWAAEAVIELMNTYPDIELHAYLPTKEPNSKWFDSTIKRYNNILSKCSEVKCFANSDTYSRDDMMSRNIALIDNCDCVITCYNGKSSGTGFTVNYAKQNKKPIINIWQEEFEKK